MTEPKITRYMTFLKQLLSFAIFSVLVFVPATLFCSRVENDPDNVAQKIAAEAGSPYDVEKIAFTFVARKDGKQIISRRHIWWPRKGHLTIETDDKVIQIQGINDYDLTKLAKAPKKHADVWKNIAEKSSPHNAAKAWGWFINDSYWLLAPSKVTDPGVQRDLDDKGRLVLTFDGVGLTPKDTYKLTFDRQSWRVTGWRFKLQSGKTGRFDWRRYKEFGPLRLSTRRVSEGENMEILFEDIVIES